MWCTGGIIMVFGVADSMAWRLCGEQHPGRVSRSVADCVDGLQQWGAVCRLYGPGKTALESPE
jgi:hypothetical protein